MLKKNEVLDALLVAEKGFICSSLLKHMLKHSFRYKLNYFMQKTQV